MVDNPNDAAHVADLERRISVLQAEVRASRNAISVSVGKFQLMTVCGGNAIDDLSKARAETDQQGALT